MPKLPEDCPPERPLPGTQPAVGGHGKWTGSRIARWISSGLVGLCLLYWLGLFVATHLPGKAVPASGQPDKLLHFVSYGGLAFLVGLVYGLKRPWTAGRFLQVLGVLALYAAVDELLQIPIPGRYGDVADWLADVTGATLGLLAVTAVHRVLKGRPSASSDGG